VNGDVKILRAIVNCARCGLDHENVQARPFARPPAKRHTHWATCPVTGEPILIGVKVVR
jgi:hypothetical protein